MLELGYTEEGGLALKSKPVEFRRIARSGRVGRGQWRGQFVDGPLVGRWWVFDGPLVGGGSS